MKNKRQDYQTTYLREQASRTKPILSGLLIGGLIGAGTALLFAPQSGERTRAEIQNKTLELRDRTTDTVKDAVSQVKAKTRQVTSDVLGKAEQLTHRGTHDEQYDEMSHPVSTNRTAVHSQ
jgi:gas vesicle protein